MPFFRKKPVVVEARKFEPNDVRYALALAGWCGGKASHDQTVIQIPTLEGVITAQIGDWIIKGVAGEFYPCKPDIFEATYEEST